MKPSFLILLIVICLASASPAICQPKGSAAKIVAHRGAWKNSNLPQNSIASLREAIRLGCYGSECDVWMTADSVLVVNHDPDFLGQKIETSTYNDLLRKKLPNGEKLPTLKEYLLEAKKQKKTRLILDIKPSRISKERTLHLTAKCVEMVSETKTKNIVDYIHFDYDACKLIKKKDPRAEVAYLNGDKSPQEVFDDGLDGIDYQFKVFQKNPDWLSDARARKLSTNVWTVNDKPLMEWFIEQKIDLITTDEPELLLEVLAKPVDGRR